MSAIGEKSASAVLTLVAETVLAGVAACGAGDFTGTEGLALTTVLGAGFATGLVSDAGTPVLMGVRRTTLGGALVTGLGAGGFAIGLATGFGAGLATGVAGLAEVVDFDSTTERAQTVTAVELVCEPTVKLPPPPVVQAQVGVGWNWYSAITKPALAMRLDLFCHFMNQRLVEKLRRRRTYPQTKNPSH
jgi:hypothetical protein